MLGRSLPLLSALLLVGACAADSAELDDDTSSAEALSGNVDNGAIVKTVTDGLRLRKTPSKADETNIVGLLPRGTRVKIVDGRETNGFYKVNVLSTPIRDDLTTPIGWVFGDYLAGRAVEPGANGTTEREESRTGTRAAPTVMRVNFTVTDCRTLNDDKGKPMTPSIDDFLTTSGLTHAVIGIDTNTFSYGARATIDEVDAPSLFNPGGTKVPLTIVKTAKTQPSGAFTVTLCSNKATTSLLPANDGMLTLSVYPN